VNINLIFVLLIIIALFVLVVFAPMIATRLGNAKANKHIAEVLENTSDLILAGKIGTDEASKATATELASYLGIIIQNADTSAEKLYDQTDLFDRTAKLLTDLILSTVDDQPDSFLTKILCSTQSRKVLTKLFVTCLQQVALINPRYTALIHGVEKLYASLRRILGNVD